MSTVVVASVGNRDVRYQSSHGGRFLLADPNDTKTVANDIGLNPRSTFREVTEELRLQYEMAPPMVTHNQFRFPILRPALDFILNETNHIDRLMLIVTNQNPPHGNDTIHCGALIKKVIKNNRNIGNNIGHIDLLMLRDRPHLADPMYEKVRDEIVQSFRGLDIDRFYALPTGGIPAITCALRHVGLNLYGGKCKVIEVVIPRNDQNGATPGDAQPLNPAPYLKDTARFSARALIEHGNYAGALDVLETFGATHWNPPHWNPPLLHLLRHAINRVNLHHRRARQSADEVRNRWPAMPPELNAALVLPQGDHAVLGNTNEVRFLIEAGLKQERYADAIVRIAQFRESCQAIFSVKMLFDNDNYNEEGDHFSAGVRTYLVDRWLSYNVNELHNALNQPNWQRRGVNGWRNVDREVVFQRAVMLAQFDNCWNDLGQLINWDGFKRDNGQRGIIPLRNHAIHTPAGVSRGRLEEEIGGSLDYLIDHLQRIVDKLYECFDKTPNDDPYPVLKQNMLSLLNDQ